MRTRCLVALLLPVVFVALLFAGTDPRRTLLIRIDDVKPSVLLKSGILDFDEYEYRSIVTMVRDTVFVLVTPAEQNLLRARGFQYVTGMEDSIELTLIRRAVYGPTLRLEEPYHT